MLINLDDADSEMFELSYSDQLFPNIMNVAKEGVRTRMAVPNPAAYPTPALHEKKVEEGGDRYQTPDRVLNGFSNDFIELSNEIYDDFNKKHGTDFKFQLKK